MRRRQLLHTLPAGWLGGHLPGSQAAASSSGGLSFPRDFGAHHGHSLEWWYLTGLLAGKAEERPAFGFQLTIFRLKGPAPAEHPSALAAKQLLIGHIALSDLRSGKTWHAQRSARAGLGLAEASEADCAVHLRDWQLRRQDLSPGRSRYLARFGQADGQGNDQSKKGFELTLTAQSTQALLLQGEQGLSRKGPQPAQFSHYYSQVQLQTQAQLRLGKQRLVLHGRSWLDHEWSDSFLGADGADRAVGWDWCGINLLDGAALTLFRLRRADGSVLWSGGSWRRPDGSTLNLPNGGLQMQALRQWDSPQGGARYPVEWQLSTPVGQWRLKAISEAQEIDARLSTGMRYWEGPAELLPLQGGPALGYGYLEMTGYAGGMNLP